MLDLQGVQGNICGDNHVRGLCYYHYFLNEAGAKKDYTEFLIN